MGKKEKQEDVRLQIPVSQELADKVNKLADRFERSQAFMVRLLLELAVDERKHFAEWVNGLISGSVAGAIHLLSGHRRRRKGQDGAVRLQVSVKRQLADEIEGMADRLGVSQVKMAALLMESALSEHDWMMHVISTRLVKAITRAFVGELPRESEGDEAEDGDLDAAQS